MASNEDEEIPGQVSPPPPPPAVVTTQPKAREAEEAGGGAAVGPGGDNMEGDPGEALSELAKADKIVVEQKAHYSSACCGYEDENKFELSDNFGNMIMRATEDSNCCLRQCCAQTRPFVMRIQDRAEKTVITVRRPLRCNNCLCCPCFTQRMEVEWPPGCDIGMVDQNLSLFSPSFDLFDANGDKTYVIEGPSSLKNRCKSLWCCCCPQGCKVYCGCALRDINFRVLDPNRGGKQVGVITKKAQPPGAGALSSEMDRFGIDFPDDADLRSKILLTSTCFLIDFLYFEGGDDDLDGDPE